MIRYRYPQYAFCLSPRHLQDVFSVTTFCLPRRLEYVLNTSCKYLSQDVFKTSWKMKNCYAEDMLKTSSRNVLKTSPRRLEDQQMFAGDVHVYIRRSEMSYLNITVFWCCGNFLDKRKLTYLIKQRLHAHFVEPVS